MPTCPFCRKEADIRVDTDQIGFFICENPECHKKLPQYLKDNAWMIQNCRTISFNINSKTHTFKIDGRIIPSLPNKLKEILI